MTGDICLFFYKHSDFQDLVSLSDSWCQGSVQTLNRPKTCCTLLSPSYCKSWMKYCSVFYLPGDQGFKWIWCSYYMCMIKRAVCNFLYCFVVDDGSYLASSTGDRPQHSTPIKVCAWNVGIYVYMLFWESLFLVKFHIHWVRYFCKLTYIY